MNKAFRIGWVGLLTLAFTPVAFAQHVAYEKYQLPNGMTVILHEDHSLPMACVNTWYHVGSKDEVAGRSGFAHLFEHLMFMGTRRVPGGDYDNIMEAGGGFNNASTSEDRTNYFSMGPAELLPTLLWLEADRLEDLGREMTQEKLDKQRKVVRNERRQSYENAPYGKAFLEIYPQMFPEGHPYHIPVIGTHEDLEAATVTDVKNFFARYYVPSNASLVVAGDFDPSRIKPLIDKLFGTLPRGSDVVHATAAPVHLTEVKRMTMTDAVQFGRTFMVYHSPARYQEGDAEMDLVAEILSSGISSRLYQRLIYQDHLAVDVSAFQSSMQLGSLFFIQATAKPGVSLDAVERAIDEVVADFLKKGPTDEELQRQKSQLEYGAVSRLQSLLAKADQLNAYEFYYGQPDSFQRDLDRYRHATKKGVRQWARHVLTPDARLVLRVIPQIQQADVNPRDERPSAEKASRFVPPEPAVFTLSNGVTVYHWQRSELPLVSMRLLLMGGSALDGPNKAGRTLLTARMLREGAGERNAMAFSDALDLLGASLRAQSRYENTTVSLSVLRSHFDSALALLADAVLRPRFDKKEWDRVKRLHVEDLKKSLDEPRTVARWVSMRTFFGDDHPYSRPIGGTVETAAALTLDDIKRFYKKLYHPHRAVFLVAGDISAKEVKEKLERAFGDWKDAPGETQVPDVRYSTAAHTGLRVVLVDRPDAVQTVIRFIMPGPAYASPDRLKLSLFNTILGGSFTSRLNQNLREQHGYTYGARSGYTMDKRVGYFTAGSSVRADVTGASLKEFLKEFAAIRQGNIEAEESRKARLSRRRSLIDSFEGLNGTLAVASRLIGNGRPFSDIGHDLQAVTQIHEADLNRLAYDAVPLEKGVLVLVGDKKLILKQIKGLELPTPVELTVKGEVKRGG